MLKDIASFFSEITDLVSEPVRAELAKRFCRIVEASLRSEDCKEEYRNWLKHGKSHFLQDCCIKDGFKATPSDLTIKATELSKFCEYWLTTLHIKATPSSPPRAFTPAMNWVRVIMVKQLQKIASGNFTTSDLTK